MVTTRNKPNTEHSGHKRSQSTETSGAAAPPQSKRSRKNDSDATQPASEQQASMDQFTEKEASDDSNAAKDAEVQESQTKGDEGPDRQANHTHIADAGTKDSNVLEHGRIFFLYKPKVGVEHVKSVDDTARFHIVLKPHSSPSDQPPILIIVGRKYLPNPTNGRQPIWSFVKDVGAEEAISHLGDTSYSTKTQGRRHVGEDRLIGEGAYALVKEPGSVSSKTQCFLAYALEEPQQPGPVQKAFQLQQHGAFGFSVKNPQTPSGPGQGLSEGATYSDELQGKFEGKRWLPLDDPAFLTYPNCEMLLLMHKQELPEDYIHALEEDAQEGAEPTAVAEEQPDVEAAKRLWEELKVPVGKKDEKVDVEPITGDWD